MNSETHAASSVFTNVTVPSFDAGSLALSDLVLGTRENAIVPPQGTLTIPITPTTARAFRADAPAWAFLRVYRAGDTNVADKVALDMTVLDAQGKRVKHQSLPNASFSGRQADARVALPMKDLAPGAYVLRIDAKQSRVEASREIAFTVTPALPVTAPTVHTAELDAALAAAAKGSLRTAYQRHRRRGTVPAVGDAVVRCHRRGVPPGSRGQRHGRADHAPHARQHHDHRHGCPRLGRVPRRLRSRRPSGARSRRAG